MICKKCGSFIDEGSLFCGECGWDVRKPYNPEPSIDPGVNIPIEIIDEDDPYSVDLPTPVSDSNPKKSKGKTIALIVALAVIVLFAVISFLAFTDFVSFQNVPVLSQYESFLQGLSAEKDEEEQPKEEPVNGEESISNPVSEDNAGQKEPYSIWSPSESEQSLKKESKESKESKDNASQSTDSDIPEELSSYKDRLVVENRNYEITLERSNYNILFRSSPELIDVDSSDSNVISRIPDGTRIYVSYIYNGTWAVHFYNGKWGFSSLYHKNDPSSTKLMKPVD